MNSITIKRDELTKNKEKRGNRLKTISMIIMLMAVTGGFLLIVSHELLTHQKTLSVINISSHREGLMYWRYGLYLIAVLLWPSSIRYLGERSHWAQESIDYLAKRQLLVLLFFAIIELFFVYNLLGHVFSIM